MKILLIQTGFLGDTVLSTPVIANLARLYPDAEIFALTTPQGAELMSFHPNVKGVITFDKRRSDSGFSGLLNMKRRLASYQFDIAFSLHKSSRTALLLGLAGIPVRYGFREAALGWLYTKTAQRSDLKHDVLRNLAIFRVLGHEPENLTQDLSVNLSNDAIAEADKLLSGIRNPLVGIAPGSVWATKRWTPEGFSKVAEMLSRESYSVVLIGGPDDREVGELVSKNSSVSLVNLIGKTSLLGSAAVIDRLQLLITNDSAPLHLASARKIPTVAIFCATVPEFGFCSWNVPHVNVGVIGLDCRPCGRHGGQTCPTGTHSCQKQLTAENVFLAARSLLDSRVKVSTQSKNGA